MKRSEDASRFERRFSHIYVEQRALDYPLTEDMLSRFSKAEVVPIKSYKSVFNRPGQDFSFQKKSVKLILAVKQPPFLYALSDQCQTFGIEDLCYTTPVLGCPFDCDYCYLHGMYSSANLVLFVNVGDFFEAVTKALPSTDESISRVLQLSLSYDTDLLALERRFHLCRQWIRFARRTPGLIVEIRTKSAAVNALKGVAPLQNVKLAWSLAPDEVIRKYEHRTPPLNKRLSVIGRAARNGWPIRLCFDPVIPIDSWQERYRETVAEVFDTVPPDRVEHVAVGPFRVNETYFKKMKRARPRCDLFYRATTIDPEEIEAFVEKAFGPFIEKEKIALWKPPS